MLSRVPQNRIMKAEAMIVFYRNSSFRPQQITMKSFLSMKKSGLYRLVNTEKEGGASASEYMSAKVTIHPKMIIPYDKEDAAYTAHAEEIAALFKEKGYAVETRPYDTLMFRSLVHSGRFDLVLLEKRTST